MKTLIVTRHAHRDVNNRHDDNGLNEKGQKQAKYLSHYIIERYKKKSLYLSSSPKLRCQETLTPLAEELGLKINIDTLLDESGTQNEGLASRVLKFIEWMNKKAPELTVICSHGDWLPLFFEETIGEAIDLKKSGIAELEWGAKEIKLKGSPHGAF